MHSKRWNALVRYDDEIRAAADALRPYGEQWITALGRDFFALNEDRAYLPNIVSRLLSEARVEAEHAKAEAERALAIAKAEAEQALVANFRRTADGEPCSDASLSVLRAALAQGYEVAIASDKAFTLTRDSCTSFLRSNYEIERYGEVILGIRPREPSISGPSASPKIG